MLVRNFRCFAFLKCSAAIYVLIVLWWSPFRPPEKSGAKTSSCPPFSLPLPSTHLMLPWQQQRLWQLQRGISKSVAHVQHLCSSGEMLHKGSPAKCKHWLQTPAHTPPVLGSGSAGGGKRNIPGWNQKLGLFLQCCECPGKTGTLDGYGEDSWKLALVPLASYKKFGSGSAGCVGSKHLEM